MPIAPRDYTVEINGRRLNFRAAIGTHRTLLRHLASNCKLQGAHMVMGEEPEQRVFRKNGEGWTYVCTVTSKPLPSEHLTAGGRPSPGKSTHGRRPRCSVTA